MPSHVPVTAALFCLTLEIPQSGARLSSSQALTRQNEELKRAEPHHIRTITIRASRRDEGTLASSASGTGGSSRSSPQPPASDPLNACTRPGRARTQQAQKESLQPDCRAKPTWTSWRTKPGVLRGLWRASPCRAAAGTNGRALPYRSPPPRVTQDAATHREWCGHLCLLVLPVTRSGSRRSTPLQSQLRPTRSRTHSFLPVVASR